MTTPALMVLGTSSHVGKSLVTAALCRIFARDGYRVSPFKAQNMSLNSAATPEGLEIGRAQALQAEAAGIPASVHMNPVLLKPSSDTASQVVVQGKIWGEVSARNYFTRRSEDLLPFIRESYERLAAQSDLMILEGAGSPAEINLKDRDVVNMRMAEMANARCVLVGDIDRGGVFASLLGTLELLEPAERGRIDGFIVNKFRGDVDLLTPGIRAIEQRMEKPCMGVVPFLENLRLDEEDSLGLEQRGPAAWGASESETRPLRVGVVCFPFLSNFTDFDPLAAEPSVEVRFCLNAAELEGADLIVLPGTKQTVADLRWLREQGMERVLLANGECAIMGICGGMQMLGVTIEDPQDVEGGGSARGLGLLPIRTVLSREKTTEPVCGEMLTASLFGQGLESRGVSGYEIHVGQTTYLEGASAFARIRRRGATLEMVPDGCVGDGGRVMGTYLHGLFHEDAFRHQFLGAMRAMRGLAPTETLVDWKRLRQREFDRLADTVRGTVDVKAMLRWVGLG